MNKQSKMAFSESGKIPRVKVGPPWRGHELKVGPSAWIKCLVKRIFQNHWTVSTIKAWELRTDSRISNKYS